MLKELLARRQQGHRTMRFPKEPPVLPDRFQGRPTLEPGRCPGDCRACREVCPTGAIEPGRLDLGKCLFCTACETNCPHGAVQFTREYRLAAATREALILKRRDRKGACSSPDDREGACSSPLHPNAKISKLFRRSLKLRQVCAGGCNACEADTNVLATVGFDLGRFGIQVVASPRHADGLLITGPVPQNMRLALEKTYAAVPAPKLVIAVGACAISGGPYADHPETSNGVGKILPVDLFIPGCPPHPLTILDGLLRLLNRID